MRNRIVGRLALVLILSLVACAGPVGLDELSGEYVVEYRFGREKLVLHRDGTYIQEIVLKGDPRTTVHTGGWKYKKPDAKAGRWEDFGVVWLRNCLLVNDGFGGLAKDYQRPSQGLCYHGVVRGYFNRSQLYLTGAGEGLFFAKR